MFVSRDSLDIASPLFWHSQHKYVAFGLAEHESMQSQCRVWESQSSAHEEHHGRLRFVSCVLVILVFVSWILENCTNIRGGCDMRVSQGQRRRHAHVHPLMVQLTEC